MSRFLFEHLKDRDLSRSQILDVCSGCGVIGLDFLFHQLNEGRRAPEKLDFLEIQEVFFSHILENQRRLEEADLSSAPQTRMNTLGINYSFLKGEEFKETYDFIFCNPPYFDRNQGQLSRNAVRNRCHFLLDAKESDLISGILNALRPQGQAFVLLPDLQAHGVQRFERLQKWMTESASAKVITEIRGTPLYLILK
jgi:tRNA1(Val) A37 N6-methylase TrmN6